MTRSVAPADSSAALPRSTSASSLQSVQLSSPRPAPSPTSSFLFSSLSHVWQGLKAAAGSQVAGFARGLSRGGVGSEEVAQTGEKRGRLEEHTEERKERDKSRGGKRRRVEFRDEVLFDGGEPSPSGRLLPGRDADGCAYSTSPYAAHLARQPSPAKL